MKLTKPLLITKLKATGVHLCLSIVIFIVLAYQIYYDWYPQPYFSIDGGWQGIRIIAAVDLVLGPLITFLIFDLRKRRREILFDLATIAVIQVSALAYGVQLTHSQRPVVAAMISQFTLTATMQQVEEKIGSPEALYAFSDARPPIIFADLQLDLTTANKILGAGLWNSALEYVQRHSQDPRAEFVDALRARQAMYTQLLDTVDAREAFAAWLAENGKKPDEVMISRLSGRYGEAWLVFDRDGGYLSYFR